MSAKRKSNKKDKVEYVRRQKRRYCRFCKSKVDYIDYKDISTIKRYVSDKGKIRPRRVTGACTQHQKDLATAIKRAREMALLPYVVRLPR